MCIRDSYEDMPRNYGFLTKWISDNPGRFTYIRPGKGGFVGTRFVKQIFFELSGGHDQWVGPYNDLAFGLHQVAKYYYYPGWQEPGPNLELIINKAAWDQLPVDLQAIVENASLAVNADLLSEYTARNNAALRELVDNHKVQLRKLPSDVLAEIRDISYAVTKKIVDPNDDLAVRIFESYSAYRAGVLSYHEISERAYINARAAK